MQQTDWSNVKVAEPEPPPKPASVASKLALAAFVTAAFLAGAVFLTVVMLGNRIRERTIDACNGPSCVLEVRSAHDDCYMDAMTISAPTGPADFQTPPSSDVFGFARVDYAAYLTCAGVADKLKARRRREAKGGEGKP